jgi:hypothetical protein
MRNLTLSSLVAAVVLAAAGPAAAYPLAPSHRHAHGTVEPGGVIRVDLVGGGSGSGSPSKCSDGTYELDAPSYYVPGTFEYWFNASSTPSGLSVSNTEQAVKESVTNWTTAKNGCGLSDQVSLTSEYQGRQSGGYVEINDDGTCQAKADSRNETGFGSLPSDLLGVACVWFGWAKKPPYPVIGADVRLNKSKSWWNTLASCTGSRYIVEAVLTHERGHVFGLTHGSKVVESGHGNLTMSPKINGYCSDAEASLGKGDVLGMRVNY